MIWNPAAWLLDKLREAKLEGVLEAREFLNQKGRYASADHLEPLVEKYGGGR